MKYTKIIAVLLIVTAIQSHSQVTQEDAEESVKAYILENNYSEYHLYSSDSALNQRPDRKDIKIEWIEQVYRFPEHQEIQADGRKIMP